jgi:hypothetical protein
MQLAAPVFAGERRHRDRPRRKDAASIAHQSLFGCSTVNSL